MKKILALALFLSSCATFKGNLPPAELPKASGDIAGRVILTRTLNDRENTTNNAGIEANLARQLGGLLESSGYTLNDSSNNKLTIRVNVDSYYSQTASTISGLTLFIIPSYAHDDYTMTATYETPKGKQTIEVKDSVSTITHLFMVFAIPFASGPTAESETTQNMFKNVLSQMKKM